MATPGYSGKPLHEKLGFKAGFTVATIGAPADYRLLLDEPSDELKVTTRVTNPDAVHIFADRRTLLEKHLAKALKSIRPDGMIWVSWPKKSSGVQTDITEDVVRAVALPMGLVDVKVCAVSGVWSGLKLVIRKSNR